MTPARIKATSKSELLKRTYRIHRWQDEKLKVFASNNGMSQDAVIREALTRLFQEEEKKK